MGATAYVTATTVTDLFYIIYKQTHDVQKTYIIMKNIFKLVSVISVTDKDIQFAFERQWKDFEDCVQYTTARDNQMDYVITANAKDYEGDSEMVLPPEEWISLFAD